MKKFFKTLSVFALVAFVVVGVSGCYKKTQKIEGIPDGRFGHFEPPVDLNEYKPYNAEIYRTIYFDFDKSDIKAESKPMLEAIAMDLKANPKKYLLIEGHCDERGTSEYNLALGERRALQTREYLINLGAGAEKIITVSYGEERPVELGHDEDAWALNRRAEFKTWAPK